MLVMFVFPMVFVTVPITLMVVVPIFIIPKLWSPRSSSALTGNDVTIIALIATNSKNTLFIEIRDAGRSLEIVIDGLLVG